MRAFRIGTAIVIIAAIGLYGAWYLHSYKFQNPVLPPGGVPSGTGPIAPGGIPPQTLTNPPVIASLSPASGPASTSVTIHGSGFSTTTGNLITFGDSRGRHHPDGSPDNMVAIATSTDGMTLAFTAPASGPSGLLCDASNHCIAIAAILLSPGGYSVFVINRNGTSTPATFTLTTPSASASASSQK